MNSQNVFHVVEVEIDCPREIPVVSAAYEMEDSTNARLGSLIAACASAQSAQSTASLNCNGRANMKRARGIETWPRRPKHSHGTGVVRLRDSLDQLTNYFNV